MLSQMKLLREPLVHFAVLGALLFGLSGLARRGGAADGGRPRPAPCGERWRSPPATSTPRAPASAPHRSATDPQELADLVQGSISEELLFREGTALGLDRDDRVVRRRVIEKMTALARPAAPDSDPPREELARHYQGYRHRFMQPAAVSFEHLYFDPRAAATRRRRRARRWPRWVRRARPTPRRAGRATRSSCLRR